MHNTNRKTIYFLLIILDLCPLTAFSQFSNIHEECTIGVAASTATSDGRPMIWKTVDGQVINRIMDYIDSERYKFICDNFPGRIGSTSMGVNEKGLAILNSQSGDLVGGNTGDHNVSFMWKALGMCSTIYDFEHLLDSTNISGRRTTSNFAVLDSTGACAIYETAGYEYVKFDANDTIIAPDGYIIRANFSVTGDGREGIERYNRSSEIISKLVAEGSLNISNILKYQFRDFSDFNSNPLSIPFSDSWNYEIPFGYIYTDVSICRFSTMSAAVFQGILPGESPKLTTMWEILGQPATSIAVPYWPVGKTPIISDRIPTSRLCDISVCIKEILFDYSKDENYLDTYKLRDETGKGLWSDTFFAEDSIYNAAEEKLEQWRNNSFSVEDILETETNFANYAYLKLFNAYNKFSTFHSNNIIVEKSFSKYNEIVDGSLLASGDDEQSVIEIPFLFTYDYHQYDKIQISTNGWLEFGSGVVGSDTGLSTSAQLSFISAPNNKKLSTKDRPTKVLAPWWDDLTTGIDGELSYKIIDNPPNRTIIVQWKNMQAYANSVSDTKINFQVRIKEKNNQIEFHYGDILNGAYTGDGASIGFKDRIGGSLRFYDLPQDKVCYEDELFTDLDPRLNWPGPDSCYTINMLSTPTSVERLYAKVPQSIYLSQNYPNPFNPSTVIKYQIADQSLPVGRQVWNDNPHVTLKVYDILGREVATLVNQKQKPGNYEITWNGLSASGGQVPSGVYFYQLTAGALTGMSADQASSATGFVETKKMILLR